MCKPNDSSHCEMPWFYSLIPSDLAKCAEQTQRFEEEQLKVVFLACHIFAALASQDSANFPHVEQDKQAHVCWYDTQVSASSQVLWGLLMISALCT